MYIHLFKQGETPGLPHSFLGIISDFDDRTEKAPDSCDLDSSFMFFSVIFIFLSSLGNLSLSLSCVAVPDGRVPPESPFHAMPFVGFS